MTTEPQTDVDLSLVEGHAAAQSYRKVRVLVCDDEPVIDLNEQALARLGAAVKKLVIVPGASHLFEEPGKLEEVARLAADWFTRYLGGSAAARPN